MALWSNKTVQVPGLASLYASSGPITAENRRHYILDTTSSGIIVNLPTGIDGFTIRITDAKGTFGTNNVTVVPATGQKINNLAVNESLLLNANEMWAEFTWNATAGFWILNAPGVLGLITSSYTDYPYIISPSSPASSNLRLYAKSDGKLYTKDPAGTEKKVGGGLDHPTTGSTFEVDAYNVSMTGTYNTGIGVGSLDSVTTGTNNTAIGIDCLTEAQSSSNNVAIGYQAAQRLNGLGANYNVYIGYTAGTQIAYNNGGAGNVGIGSQPLCNVTSGYYNVGIGPSALQTVTSGFYNVGFGYSAGFGLSTGSYNTIINAGSQGNYSGIVVIGYDSAANKATASANNQFILGTSNHLYQFPGVAQTSLILGPTGTSTGQTGTLSFRELAANGSNTVTLRAPDVLGSDVTLTLPDSAGTNGQFLTTNGSGVLSWSSVNTSNSTVTITQNSHGFVAADIGRPVYLNGSTYALAKADVESTAEVAGLINSIVDTNNFTLCLAGEVSSVGANLIDGGGSLVAGTMYFLSASTAGKITATSPSIVGQISKPVGIARSTSAIDFYNMRGASVGGANVYTQIALTNNAVTTIQNVSAYDSIELQGSIYLTATSSYRFLFKAQVTKKGDSSDYIVSFQVSGDTPPDGFNITVTSIGLVQVTLPNLSGFSSAIAQFSLNGPSVGAFLPLQIESTSVSFSTIQAKSSAGIIFKENDGTTVGSLSDTGAWSFGKDQNYNTSSFTAFSVNGGKLQFRYPNSSIYAHDIRIDTDTYAGQVPMVFVSDYTGVSSNRIFSWNNGSSEVGFVTEGGSWRLGEHIKVGSVLRTYLATGSISNASGTTFDLFENAGAYGDINFILAVRVSSGWIKYQQVRGIIGGYGATALETIGDSSGAFVIEFIAGTTGFGKIRLRLLTTLPSNPTTIEISGIIFGSNNITALNGSVGA